MSGGSLNYLYCKEPQELFNEIESLTEAEATLLRDGYKDIARDVRRLIEYVQSAENRIGVLHEQLTDVFHAVEWYYSGDYGRDTYKNVLETYRRGRRD